MTGFKLYGKWNIVHSPANPIAHYNDYNEIYFEHRCDSSGENQQSHVHTPYTLHIHSIRHH